MRRFRPFLLLIACALLLPLAALQPGAQAHAARLGRCFVQRRQGRGQTLGTGTAHELRLDFLRGSGQIIHGRGVDFLQSAFYLAG